MERATPSLFDNLEHPLAEDIPFHAIYAATKKKYKPVAVKVRPLKAPVPEYFRIIRHITGNPLANLPQINYTNIPPFVPTGRYT